MILIKFFDDQSNFGFAILPDGSNIFAHFDDLSKGGISKEILNHAKYNYTITLSFIVMNYLGKNNKPSKKAVEIQLVNIEGPRPNET